MSDQPVRFLHASDFQLDEPVRGLTELPDHLREVLIDSAYQSAERVFDTALAESVAFVCLAGNLLDLAHPTVAACRFCGSSSSVWQTPRSRCFGRWKRVLGTRGRSRFRCPQRSTCSPSVWWKARCWKPPADLRPAYSAAVEAARSQPRNSRPR